MFIVHHYLLLSLIFKHYEPYLIILLFSLIFKPHKLPTFYNTSLSVISNSPSYSTFKITHFLIHLQIQTSQITQFLIHPQILFKKFPKYITQSLIHSQILFKNFINYSIFNSPSISIQNFINFYIFTIPNYTINF